MDDYDFHYNFIKKNFNVELLFTDTDSLTYEIKSENVYEEFLKWKDLFEVIILKIQSFSMRLIKKLLVKWKMNIVSEVIIDQFIGLKSKIYSIKKIDDSESITAKGVNVATEFSEFKDVLFNKKVIRHKMKRIQAKKHKIRTYEIDKISDHVLMIKYLCYLMELIL